MPRMTLEDLACLKADEWYDTWHIHRFTCAVCGLKDLHPRETMNGLRCSFCGGEGLKG